jgi:2-haloalkanoic acid dehalogenase type II
MKLTDFKVLTFDCYGTLIDWESGIHAALEPLIELSGLGLGRDEALEAFARRESAQEAATPAMLYPELLARVHADLAADWGVDAPAEMHARFGASVPDWPAFADSAASLLYLQKYYKLAVLSNIDRASFKASNRKLEVTFDAVYTAEDVGSYKPAPRNFEHMIEHLAADLGLGKGDILHTAQSLFHDHAPARDFGLATAWIDRRHDQAGWGATMPLEKAPEVDFHVTSMAAFVKAHQEALRTS